MQEQAIYLWQALIYGVLKRKPSIDLSLIPDKFTYTCHYDKTNKVHWVEVPELPEFIVTGKTPEELAENFIDTVCVYFDIPTYFARKFNASYTFNYFNHKTGKHMTIHDDSSRDSPETQTLKAETNGKRSDVIKAKLQETFRLNFREELDRVMA
jgi:hypothetical protein